MEGDGSVQLSAVCSVMWCVVVCGGGRVNDETFDMDHIRCVCSFKVCDTIEQHLCCNFNKLQLLPKHENRHVKGTNYIPAEYEQTDAYKAIELLVPGWVDMYTA